MEEKLKDVLHCVFRIDNIVNKFHNKVQFMNLNFLMGRVESWEESQLDLVHENLRTILNELEKVKEVVEALEEPALDLIESYTPPDGI